MRAHYKFLEVGTWTAEMVLFAGLKRNSTFPAGDLGVKEHLRFYAEEGISSESEVRE